MLRGFDACINIGYIDSPPFSFESRRGPNLPDGLLVQLMELFLQLLGVHWKWQPIPFARVVESLENRSVDLISGFILDAPSRQTRGRFIPLDMPFAIGINAVTRSPDLQTGMKYNDLAALLQGGSSLHQHRFGIVTVLDEIADEFFPALFMGVEPTIRDDQRSVKEALRYYTSEHPDRDLQIVFADSMSCSRLLPPGAKLLLTDPIGRFQGGFLLPVHDEDWAQYFGNAFHGFLKARLPQVGRLFSDYSQQLLGFLQTSDRPLALTGNANSSGMPGHDRREFWTLRDWLQAYWPRELPVPPEFCQHLAQHEHDEAGGCEVVVDDSQTKDRP